MLCTTPACFITFFQTTMVPTLVSVLVYIYICNSYTMGMRALYDIYALAQGLQALGKVCICNSYNIDTSNLPEIYARAQQPKRKCVYFKQITSAHAIINILHFCNSLAVVGESFFISLIAFIEE